MENYRLKGCLNSVKEWLIGTSVKISVKSRLQNLPGQSFMNILHGYKLVHSPYGKKMQATIFPSQI